MTLPLPRLAAGLFAAVVLLLTASDAAAQSRGASWSLPTGPDHLVRPLHADEKPPLRQRTAQAVARIAAEVPKVRDELREHPGATRDVFMKGTALWQVSWYAKFRRGEPRKEIAQVTVGDRTGAVIEAWTGFRVAWSMARGYDGAFGREVNAVYIWIPLAILFVLPFLDPRRPRRLLHLDLLVLSAFSVSLAFFNAGDIETSVPLVYPLLAYLLARMLWVGLRRRPRAEAEPLHLLVPVSWLAIATVFLLGFRVGLNIVDSNVIDVGYAGVIGADRLMDGKELYGAFPDDNDHGDTYGPVLYALYVPFEQLLPWSGKWDDLPAAHAAAIVFDLLTVAGLWLLGRRAGGPRLGVALAYAWAAFPFTLFALNTNTNDSLVSLLLVITLLLIGRPAARGVLAALAGLTKFAALGLAPLLATVDRKAGRTALFVAGFAAVCAVALLPLLGDLDTFYDRTLGFQAGRDSPFSIWGLYEWDGAQLAVQIAAVALAIVLAVVPRRHDLPGLAAQCAAVLVALQLATGYWFYLYIVWFFPLVMLALLGPRPAAEPAAARVEEETRREEPVAA